MGRHKKNYLDDPIVNGPLSTEPPPELVGIGESRSVTLKSGGTLTLWTSTKFMMLKSADRAFVFELIDKLVEYEEKNADTGTP
jgi:hypothetical protein